MPLLALGLTVLAVMFYSRARTGAVAAAETAAGTSNGPAAPGTPNSGLNLNQTDTSGDGSDDGDY
jgi:hypothetical protein